MSDVKFLMAVVRRERAEEYVSFFNRHKVPLALSLLCEGTAKKKTLDLWGLESKEKTMLCCILPSEHAKGLMHDLVWEMRLDAPNEGIAVTVSIDSRHKSTKQADSKEVIEMNDALYTLIITIAQRGYSTMVMDAARQAGATGGTIVHAKGTGAEIASKFFGVSIADEKDMIYIVAKQDDRDAIMSAIKDGAGKDTPAKAVVFSTPVDAVTGLFGMNK